MIFKIVNKGLMAVFPACFRPNAQVRQKNVKFLQVFFKFLMVFAGNHRVFASFAYEFDGFEKHPLRAFAYVDKKHRPKAERIES